MLVLRSYRVIEDSYESQNIVDSSTSWAQEETVKEEDEELLEEDEEFEQAKLGGEDKEKEKLDEDLITYQPKVSFLSVLEPKPADRQTCRCLDHAHVHKNQ